MPIEKTIPLVEQILDRWKWIIKKDFVGYKNHVYRMLHFCFYLHESTEEERQKLMIAACFHDLGLWSDKTVELMIDMHHKLREYSNINYPLVEVFRKADLADFSLGLIKCGVSTEYITQVKANFPNAGFHKMLCKELGRWFLKHPLNPFPIIKW